MGFIQAINNPGQMDNETPGFDAAATLDTVRQARQERRHRRTWGKSKLVRHRAELVKLRQAGASLADLAHWLKTDKRMKADKSTIARYLATLPEMQPEGKPPRPGGENA
jgi:hypothetical protein